MLFGTADVFEVVTYGSRAGVFGTINLPPLAAPTYWDEGLLRPPECPNALTLWAVTGA